MVVCRNKLGVPLTVNEYHSVCWTYYTWQNFELFYYYINQSFTFLFNQSIPLVHIVDRQQLPPKTWILSQITLLAYTNILWYTQFKKFDYAVVYKPELYKLPHLHILDLEHRLEAVELISYSNNNIRVM